MANIKLTIGHNFPGNSIGEYSEYVDAPTLREAKLAAAKCLYDDYTPYYEYEVFDALAKWLQNDADTFCLSFGDVGEMFSFYIEPCDY